MIIKRYFLLRGLELGGKIDRIDITPEDSLEIIDYKTGKEKEGMLQLMAYVFLTEGLFNKPVNKASYLYLKSGNWQSIVPEKPLREQTKGEILGIVDKIAAETEWKPNISRLCSYCDYMDFCPEKEKVREFI